VGAAKTVSLSLLALWCAVCAGADESRLLISSAPVAAPDLLASGLSEGESVEAVARWQFNDVGGSANRFEQYGAAPAGGFLERLLYSGGAAGKSSLFLQLNAPGQPTTSGLLAWRRFYPLGYLELGGERYRFHLYPQADGAMRQGLHLNAGTVLEDRKTVARFSAQTNTLRLPKPGSVLNHTINNYRLDLTRPVGSGDIDVALALREYRNRDGLQPGTSWGQYALRYLLSLPSLANLGAEYAYTQVEQGTASPRVRSFALNATSPVGSPLIASVSLDSRRLTGAVERNGYTRAVETGRAEVRYHGIRGMSLRAGYDRRELDRVNHAQTATEEPIWHKVWASARYRPIRSWQVVARASHRSTPTPPSSGLTDAIPLAFNLDRSAELRIEGTPIENTGIYFVNSARFRKNTRRNLEMQTDSASIGAWAQVGDRLSLNADYGLQHVDSRNFILYSALSDAWVTTLGGTYSVSPRTRVEATYSNHRASRAQRLHQNVWGLGLHRQLGRGASWNLEFRRDVYDNLTTPALGYTANVLTVGGSSQF
jgi:hypothetical protein